MSELRECPFCGKKLIEAKAFSGDGFPHMCTCIWNTGSAEEVMMRWNTRPLEDALSAENAKLVARIAALEAAGDELVKKWQESPNGGYRNYCQYCSEPAEELFDPDNDASIWICTHSPDCPVEKWKAIR